MRPEPDREGVARHREGWLPAPLAVGDFAVRAITSTCACCVALLAALACRPTAPADRIDPTVTLDPPGGATRIIEFTTDEGTGMSVDVSPDGSWLAFDLLGHVYRVPIAGGAATALTQNSGPALNFHPAISPDGRHVAFASTATGNSRSGPWPPMGAVRPESSAIRTPG